MNRNVDGRLLTMILRLSTDFTVCSITIIGADTSYMKVSLSIIRTPFNWILTKQFYYEQIALCAISCSTISTTSCFLHTSTHWNRILLLAYVQDCFVIETKVLMERTLRYIQQKLYFNKHKHRSTQWYAHIMKYNAE